MKSKVIQNKIKEFQPITIEITIESLGELKNLLMRLNHGSKHIIEFNTEHGDYQDNIEIIDNSFDLWKELDTLYSKLKR